MLRRGVLVFLSGVLLLGAGILFSGCVDDRGPYTDKQVRALLDERFPDEAVSFQRASKKVWDCWFDDLPEVVFQVQVSVGGGDPVPMLYTYLGCNVRDVFWRYYVDTYCAEVGRLDAWEIVRLDSGETYVSFSYTTMTEVQRAADELAAFYEWGKAQSHGEYLQSVECVFEGGALPDAMPLSHKYTLYPDKPCEELVNYCADIIREYHAYYLLPCADFSREELLDFAATRWDWTAMYSAPDSVWRGDEPLPLEMFSGIYVSRYTEFTPEFTFGGIYELARRLGFAIEGTPEHFSFVGACGKRYEFSYDFCHDVTVSQYGGKTAVKTVWYYFVDGEVVEQEPWEYANSGTTKPKAAPSRQELEAMLGVRFAYEPKDDE